MRRSRRSAAALSALAVVALAAATVGLSGATFTTQTGNVRVTAQAGDLELTSTRDGQAVVAGATGMRPGQTRSGEVTVSNDGSVAGGLAFDVLAGIVDVPASPRLSDVLRLRLERCTSGPGCTTTTPVVDAPLSVLATGAWNALGTVAAGSAQTFRVTLEWPAAASDPDLQGSSTQATLAFALEAGS